MTSLAFQRVSALAGVLAAVTLVSACGSSARTTSAAPVPASAAASAPASAPAATAGSSAAAPKVSVISIKDFAYQGPGSVTAGSTVTVRNLDSVAHTVTADRNKSLFDVTIDPDSTATFTAPSSPGSYPYHCTFHSNMHGTLVVT